LIVLFIAFGQVNIRGPQEVIVDSFTDSGQTASLRTNVSEDCAASMQELHGEDAWATALAEQAAIDEAGGVAQARELSEEERAEAVLAKVAAAAPIGTGIALIALLAGLGLALARGVAPSANPMPLIAGAGGILALLLVDILLIGPLTTPGTTVVLIALPMVAVLYGLKTAGRLLFANEIVKVVFPPLVLIIAVLGSILGGITNPTPAAALGAGGAILLATFRKLQEQGKSGNMVLYTTAAIMISVARSPRNGEGHVDGVHHPDRVATAEPRADLVRRGALYPAIPALVRQRMDGLALLAAFPAVVTIVPNLLN